MNVDLTPLLSLSSPPAKPDSDVSSDVHSSAAGPESLLPSALRSHQALAESDGSAAVLQWALQEPSHGPPRGHEHGEPSQHSSNAEPAHAAADGWTGELPLQPLSAGSGTSVSTAHQPYLFSLPYTAWHEVHSRCPQSTRAAAPDTGKG